MPPFDRLNRRAFLAGLGAVAAGLAVNRVTRGGMFTPRLLPTGGGGAPPFGCIPNARTTPIISIPTWGTTETIGGFPFAPKWYGDEFPKTYIPFHNCEDCDPMPDPYGKVEVAIVGGGLSGLATAYQLRDRSIALFELRPRFGGNAAGEQWNGVPYSLGSAYFMIPEKGDDFDLLYKELGVYDLARFDTAPYTYEFGGSVYTDLCLGCSSDDKARVDLYLQAVQKYYGDAYPEIPIPAQNAESTYDLDSRSYLDEITNVCGGSIPAPLARALQAYCYSSFGVGWGELSAAAGWNFVAAEEGGRIVLPGGNSTLATLFWKALYAAEPPGGGLLRAGCTVVRVELKGDGAIVTWRGADGILRATEAKHVVMAGAKHIVKHMLPDLAEVDPEKQYTMDQIGTECYVVANVLLKSQWKDPYYDLFTIHDANFPMDDLAFVNDRRITDVVAATWASAAAPPQQDVLTCYWPLPWQHARFTIIAPEDWKTYAGLAAPQLENMLAALGISKNDVMQVRLARWGHAMPFARPGQLSTGMGPILRRPLNGCVWFASQDNWLLPAVETCLGEAWWVSAQVRSALGAP